MSVVSLHTNKRSITHELIAGLMGVRREAVAVAVSNSRTDNPITFPRDQNTVDERTGIDP